MSGEIQPRTFKEAFGALSPEAQRELAELAVLDKRMTSAEHRLDRLEAHLAGKCLEDCPCKPWNQP